MVAEIPGFSKHKWLKTRLKFSDGNRRRLKGATLLWFVVMRRVVTCSTLAKDFSWAPSLASGTTCCTKSLLSDNNFNSMTWLLLLLTENEMSVCPSYSIREDEPGDKSHGEAGRAGTSQSQWGHSVTEYLNKKSRVDLVRVTRVIQESRSLGASTVTRHVRDQATK